LANASVEAAQIQDALGDGALRVDENAQATRSTVLATLEQAGAWLHIAAHGMAQPQRIGYAGIWLEPPAAEAAPAFLSWLDVLDSGVRADLVVLDACQLGDSGSAVSGNLSFADAVSRAGARRVVAALWPVSDAAAALWVPAFYRSLLADAGYDSALALRTAQLRLRASRAFTHPFFWAGLQSIERLDLPVPPRKAR
jgi:CHAT domain-containing protein